MSLEKSRLYAGLGLFIMGVLMGVLVSFIDPLRVVGLGLVSFGLGCLALITFGLSYKEVASGY